jgi:ABC-type sugar transport system ATPase subunit
VEPPANQPIVAFNEVSKQYPGQLALNDVTFDINAGEIHALVGENGAGKSTLIRILAGLTAPSRGGVCVNGSPIRISGPASARALGFSFVHQEPEIAANLSVAENVFAGSLPVRRGRTLVDPKQLSRATKKILDSFEIDVDPRAKVGTLSAPIRRVVEIARAVSRRSRLLVLDEPTAALPAHERDVLLGFIRRFAEAGGAVLYVSHHIDEVLKVADRLTALRNGVRVGTELRSDLTREKIIRMMLGSDVSAYLQRGRSSSGGPALSVNRLVMKEGDHPLDLRLSAGEVVGVIGRNEAGHEGFVRILAGGVRAHSGAMQIADQPYHPRSIAHARHERVVLLPGDRKLEGVFHTRSVAENIAAGNKASTRWGFISRSKENDHAQAWKGQLGIKADSVTTSIRSLSGGNQQKALFARVLAMDPKLLVLEHPTAGVDLGARRDIYAAIAQAAENGIAVIILSDDLEEIQTICDRVVVFRDRRISGTLEGNDIASEQMLRLAL